MRNCLFGGLATLALGVGGLGVAPAASAGPFCSFFDVAGLCDVRDAFEACDADPQACANYTPPAVSSPAAAPAIRIPQPVPAGTPGLSAGDSCTTLNATGRDGIGQTMWCNPWMTGDHSLHWMYGGPA